jgi:L-arabinokinase
VIARRDVECADPPKIAYYVSAHGYGHGVRSCDIIAALHRLYPALSIAIISDLPRSFFDSRLGKGPRTHRLGRFDVGMIQLDSIRVDVPRTLAEVESLYARRDDVIASEAAYLAAAEIALVVADIPALPLEAAARLRLPRVAIGNFSWDWIYSAFLPTEPRWGPLVRQLARGYAEADLLLRLPFSAEMTAFRAVEDLPLVASPGRPRRAELAALTGADPARTWVLLSFVSLDWDEGALDAVESLTRHEFFTVRPLAWHRRNIHPVDRERMPFADVVASVDAVVSKPGYGILSDCALNRKPLLYADRADFAEYPLLVDAMRTYLKRAHIPADRLYRGALGPALDALWGQPDPPAVAVAGGAEIAARRLATLAGIHG